MGQSFTKDVVKEFNYLKDKVILDYEAKKLSYEEFLEMIKELNRIFKQTEDKSGNTLFFMVKGGSDSSFLWREFVRISCIKIEKTTKKMQGFKLLTLIQFLQAYKIITHCIKPWLEVENTEGESSTLSSDLPGLRRNPISASMILNEIEGKDVGTDIEECIVCMERRPEITLPCAHSYCLFCIEQWNVSNKTCPVCREAIESTDDSWVLPDIPDSAEISEELTKIIDELPSEPSFHKLSRRHVP